MHPPPLLPALALVLSLAGCATRDPVVAERLPTPLDIPLDHRSSRRASEGAREQILSYIGRVRAARGAIFIRNGLDYSGEQAAEFLQRKWEHKGDAVRTAEEFLAQVATRSESCGEPYRVVLPEGTTVLLARWLREDAAHATAPSRPRG